MKIINETSLNNFEFWSGAICWAEQLSYSEMETLETILEDIYPDRIDDTTLNDLFWFDFEWICDLLGLELDDNEDVVRD